MAAYAALVSLAKVTDLNRYQGNNRFPIEVGNQIRSIHEYALYLQSFLEDFPEKAKRWESRIRDLSHEAEDYIEDFIWLRIQMHHQGVAPTKLQQHLQNVSEKLGLIAGDVIYERPPHFPVVVSSSSRLTTTASDTVVGLEDVVTTIRDRLCGQPSSNLQLVPIVGMGGIGKTTLAKTVYDHVEISRHFDFRAWITVSQDYSLRKILLGLLESIKMLEELALKKNMLEKLVLEQKNMLEELVLEQKINGSDVGVEERDENIEKVDMSKMSKKVFQSLKSRRYLIVMDDVWSTDVLDDVKNIFPDDGCGSRIIITTRLSNLTAYPNSNGPLHEMQVMNDAQSWNLLKHKVFTNGDCPHTLEDIGEEIARSCAGLPLAIVLVAGLLLTVNNSRASWEVIAGKVKRVVGQGSEAILSLSYTHLPHHLRPCFLYLGGFPEDENIRASRLIKLWEAEGFLKYKNESDESLAEQYLEDLVERNLVFVNSRKINGKIRSCSLHDIVRDLCIRKSMEEKFLHVIKERTRFDSQDMMDERRLHDMVRDFCISKSMEEKHMLLHFIKQLTRLNSQDMMDDPSLHDMVRDMMDDLNLHDMVRDFCISKSMEEKHMLLHCIKQLTSFNPQDMMDDHRLSFHDMVRDFCISKSMEEKHMHLHFIEQLLTLFNSQDMMDDHRLSLHDMVRYLCIGKWMEEKYLPFIKERKRFNSQDMMDDHCLSLHDMVRYLCIGKLMEEKYLHFIKEPKRFDSQDMMDERRVSLRHPRIDCLLAPTIRTILSFDLKHFAKLLQFLGRFRLLRVLHDASINPQQFSSQVFELIHLRYLALDRLNITSAISKLVNLETLIIFPAFDQKKRKSRDYKRDAFRLALPSEIWRMQQLKHLIFYDFYTLPYLSESNLPSTNLQTLSLIENLVFSENMVQMIPNVKRLGLVYSTHQDYHLRYLEYLLKLEKLKVYGCWSLFWRGQDRCFSRTLKKLSLVGGGFPWADMSIIGSLPYLQVLKLRDYACIGETWETCDDEFAQLIFLAIESSFLREWTVQSGSFPILERLVLRACWDLEKIPEEIGEISTLELIEVEDCMKSVVKSAEQMKEYQQSCGNDALQVSYVGEGRTWSSRLGEIAEEDMLHAGNRWRSG